MKTKKELQQGIPKQWDASCPCIPTCGELQSQLAEALALLRRWVDGCVHLGDCQHAHASLVAQRDALREALRTTWYCAQRIAATKTHSDLETDKDTDYARQICETASAALALVDGDK